MKNDTQQNQRLPAVSPLPEDQEIVDEIRSAVSQLRQDDPDAAAQVVSGLEEETAGLEQAPPVRSVREVRPVADDGGDMPAFEPAPEQASTAPQEEIPPAPVSQPEAGDLNMEDGEESHHLSGRKKKKEKKEKEKKSRKSRKEKEQELELEMENDIYQGVHIRSFAEIKKDMEAKGPKLSEPTSTFTYLYDDTTELPKVLLSKDPEELKRERKARAQHAMEEALTETPLPEVTPTEQDVAIDTAIAPEFGHRQAAKPDDRPIIIDGFDYTEWKRTTQSIPKITDEMLAAHAAQQAAAETAPLPVSVHPSQESDTLPVGVSAADQRVAETMRELESLMEQALAEPETPEITAPAPEVTAPVQEPEVVTPATEPEVAVPVKEPEVVTPAKEPEVAAPVKEPEVTTPVKEPEVAAPVKEPEVTTPVKEPEVAAPVKEPEVTTPVKEPEVAAPAKEPEIVTPIAEPAQAKPAPTVHFVPVSDPERYRFHQIPVRTFRLDEINQILAAEVETFCHPEGSADTVSAAPSPAKAEVVQTSQPVKNTSGYGKAISIPAGGMTMEAAIAAAIRQADAAEAAAKAQAEQEKAEASAKTQAEQTAAESEAKAQPEQTETEAPTVEKPEQPETETPTEEKSEQAETETTTEAKPEQAETEAPAEAKPEQAEAETSTEAKPEPDADKTPATTDSDDHTPPAPSEPTAEQPAEPAEPDDTPAEQSGETSPEAATKPEAKSEPVQAEQTSDDSASDKTIAFPQPEKQDSTLSTVPTQTIVMTPAMEIPLEDPAEEELPAEKHRFSFLHKRVKRAPDYENEPFFDEPFSEGLADEEPAPEEPADYTKDSDPKEISEELQTATRELHIRTLVTGFFTLALLVLGFVYEKWVPETASALPYLIIDLACIVIPAAVCGKTIWNGIKALFGLQGNTDSGISIAVLATIVHDIAMFFAPSMVMTGAVHLYSSIAVGALLVNSLGKLSMMNRISRNFIFVTSADVKCSVEFYEDMNTAIQLAKGCVTEAPKIAYQQRTKFLKNFLKHSYEGDPSMRTSQLIAPIALVASAVLCIVTIIITGSVILGLTALSVAACISAPIASLLCVNLPVANLCNLARRHGAMLTGYEAVEKLSHANAVMVDSTDLFPKNSVSLADIKVYAGKKTERSIFNAAAVMSNIGGTLRDLFEGVITSQKEMLPKATNIAYVEGRGMSGTVAGKKILIGNRAMMEENNIEVPNDDRMLHLQSNQCVTFLAEDGELMAMLTITYEPDRNTVHEMQRLESCGIAAIVRTLDPNLTTSFLSTLFLVEETAIKVLPAELGDCCDKALQTVEPECDALLATRGKSFSMMRMLSACVRQKHNISLSVAMQIVSVILGFILVAFLSCYAGLQQLSTLAILIYEAVWLAAIIIIPKLRKP